MTQKAIDIANVTRHFGEFTAVDRVSFSVEPGEIFGLIGHNGAGKSTLFKMMLGLLPVSSGEIQLCGQSISEANFREVRRRIGYLPENVVLYDNLTGRETLAFFAKLKGVDLAECDVLLKRVGLLKAIDRRVGNYSKGMRQRLGFAQALLGSPQLLLLDEPTTGLDPEAIHEFYAMLDTVRAEGATVILTSHILAEIEQRVDRLALMSGGKLVAVGTVSELSTGIDLPARVELSVADSARADLLAALAQSGFAAEVDARGIVNVNLARDRKHELLPILAQRSTMISDMRFIEPTLEAIFISHRRREKEAMQ